MRILLIDDDRVLRFAPSTAQIFVARSSARALELLQADQGPWHEIWFDHDLGELPDGRKDTTLPVLDYFSLRAVNDEPVPVQHIFIHTGNRVGRADLRRGFERYGYGYREVFNQDEVLPTIDRREMPHVFERGWLQRM